MAQKTKTLLIILGVAVVIFAFGGIILLAGGETPSIDTGSTAARTPTPAPDFELDLYSGKKFRLSDLKGKKPVVINFWASWCGPCRDEAPVLAKLGKAYGKDVEFIGVVVNDTQPKAEAFLKEFDITYENGPDKTDIARDYKLTGIPETFWIDKQGRIVDHWIGAIDEPNMTARTRALIEN